MTAHSDRWGLSRYPKQTLFQRYYLRTKVSNYILCISIFAGVGMHLDILQFSIVIVLLRYKVQDIILGNDIYLTCLNSSIIVAEP